MEAELTTGVARADITPPVGIAHGNWGAQTHERAAGVDLPLWATTLALSDGKTTFVVVDLDLIYLRREHATAVREAVAELTGLPTSHVRISYTHTHSGPTTRPDSWVEKGEEKVIPYLDSLPHVAAGTALDAVNDMRPVRMAAGCGHSEIAVNRRLKRPEDGAVVVGRNWEGTVDHDVEVLRFDDANGTPLAVVAHYACHPITVGPDNDLITPDYPGVVKRVVEESTGATCLFLQGAAGNVGPIHGVVENGIEEYKPLGRRLGHEVARVAWAIEPHGREERYVETLESGAPLAVYEYDYEDQDVSLAVATSTAELPLVDFPPVEELEAEYGRYEQRLRELQAEGGNEAAISETTMRARRTYKDALMARQFEDQSYVDFEVQVFALGEDVALIATPGEPFVEIAQRVKDGSPFEQTAFSGYSNVLDYSPIYVPTADAYPDGGYEVETSPLTPRAADVLVKSTLDLLGTIETDNS